MINPKLYNSEKNRVVKITSKNVNEETRNKAGNIYKIERRQKDRRKNQAASFDAFIKHKVEQYFVNLEGHEPTDLYDLFIREIEKPFLQAVLLFSGDNQTKAAKVLGVSRSTIRKKIEHHNLY